MAVTFRSTVLQAPGMKATGITVPDEVIEALGGSKKPAVTVVVAGFTYRTTVATRYGGYIFPLSAEHRSASGLGAGDPVEVTLELDIAPRTVEVPDDLAAALGAAPGIRAAFDALSPSQRKAHVTNVEGTKNAETRARRVSAVVEKLSRA
jgi:hypothetical protein